MEEIRSKYYTYFKSQLENGLTVLIYPRPQVHTTYIRTSVHVGALHETQDQQGYAHFIEHLVHRATERFSSWEELDRFIIDHSGSTNAFTSFEETRYQGGFPKHYLEAGLEYFSELTLNPLLREEDIDKERSIILDEIRRAKDTIDLKIARLIRQNRFTNTETAFSNDIFGTPESVKKATKERLLAFYESHYQPSNMTILAGGAV